MRATREDRAPAPCFTAPHGGCPLGISPLCPAWPCPGCSAPPFPWLSGVAGCFPSFYHFSLKFFGKCWVGGSVTE